MAVPHVCPSVKWASNSFRQPRGGTLSRYMFFDRLIFDRLVPRVLSQALAIPGGKSTVVRAQGYAHCEASDGMHGDTPKHIAIIMDGNGRWAGERGHKASIGHQAGIDALQRVVEACIEVGVTYLSVFALSTENSSSRNQEEINFLISLVNSVVHERLMKLHSEGVKLKFIGNISSMGNPGLSRVVQRAEGLTGGNDTLVLTIALNFSGQEDIVTATKNIAKRVSDGHLDICEINRSLMSENLSLSHIVKEHENPDLLIRTGGEQRLSNFVLWHLAYTELYFSQVYWPDFNEKHLMEALREYSRRDRRFGARSLD